MEANKQDNSTANEAKLETNFAVEDRRSDLLATKRSMYNTALFKAVSNDELFVYFILTSGLIQRNNKFEVDLVIYFIAFRMFRRRARYECKLTMNVTSRQQHAVQYC